jgi:hypothetical protein
MCTTPGATSSLQRLSTTQFPRLFSIQASGLRGVTTAPTRHRRVGRVIHWDDRMTVGEE